MNKFAIALVLAFACAPSIVLPKTVMNIRVELDGTVVANPQMDVSAEGPSTLAITSESGSSLELVGQIVEEGVEYTLRANHTKDNSSCVINSKGSLLVGESANFNCPEANAVVILSIAVVPDDITASEDSSASQEEASSEVASSPDVA